MEAFKLHDRDKNGFITAKEIRRTIRENYDEEQTFSLFRAFDFDGNGKTSEVELRKAAQSMVRLADDDGDLRLNFYEFNSYQGGAP